MPTASHFNPRSPHGERQTSPRRIPVRAIFQSTLPARGATSNFLALAVGVNNFNPRSPHGERRHADAVADVLPRISIHAPRTGSDVSMIIMDGCCTCISIHAPRTGSDNRLHELLAKLAISIHAPRTGSDRRRPVVVHPDADFNPRSPHGERHVLFGLFADEENFNPRSPHGERPAGSSSFRRASLNFNPRSPHGERRTAPRLSTSPFPISIHAPRTGSDAFSCLAARAYSNFNPRSPHGERLFDPAA